MIIMAYPTVMDGLVLRWYRDETAAEIGRESMSVSRNGVTVDVFLHEIPADQLEAAKQAHAWLALRTEEGRQRAAALATHQRIHLVAGGRVKPVKP